MDDTNRNITEVIMQIHNVFRYADLVFRLTTIGTIKLIQFLARMAKEEAILPFLISGICLWCSMPVTVLPQPIILV